jgi:hypothetical protein
MKRGPIDGAACFQSQGTGNRARPDPIPPPPPIKVKSESRPGGDMCGIAALMDQPAQQQACAMTRAQTARLNTSEPVMSGQSSARASRQ